MIRLPIRSEWAQVEVLPSWVIGIPVIDFDNDVFISAVFSRANCTGFVCTERSCCRDCPCNDCSCVGKVLVKQTACNEHCSVCLGTVCVTSCKQFRSSLQLLQCLSRSFPCPCCRAHRYRRAYLQCRFSEWSSRRLPYHPCSLLKAGLHHSLAHFFEGFHKDVVLVSSELEVVTVFTDVTDCVAECTLYAVFVMVFFHDGLLGMCNCAPQAGLLDICSTCSVSSTMEGAPIWTILAIVSVVILSYSFTSFSLDAPAAGLGA